jgi:hypothetical protein
LHQSRKAQLGFERRLIRIEGKRGLPSIEFAFQSDAPVAAARNNFQVQVLRFALYSVECIK